MDEHGGARGTAFGLAIDADFAIPGLHGSHAGRLLPTTTLTLGDEQALARAWRPAEPSARRVSEERFRGDEPGRTIDAHPEVGYRLFARYFGSCLVSPDGARLLCVPPPIRSWRWQRFLVGRCLPLAAMLRGYEVLHAGAVEIDGGIVAVIGARGAGKTSLTLHLVLQGAGFVTDDVLALETHGPGLLAHPGFGVVNVRAVEDERLGERDRAALGALLGQTGRDKRHYALAPVDGPRRLRTVYFLLPGDGRSRATIATLDAPDPRRLLTSTFIHETRPREHLAGLLDVCAKLSDAVPMFEVTIGADEDAATLAGRMREHVAAELGA
jgi:hypothetical protein